jgi:hypothetical protein
MEWENIRNQKIPRGTFKKSIRQVWAIDFTYQKFCWHAFFFCFFLYTLGWWQMHMSYLSLIRVPTM